MIEPTLSLDSTGKNVVLLGSNAKFRQIYNLLFMKKGTDILNNDKGVDIKSYNFSILEDSTLVELETTITDQITKYTAYVPANVFCRARKHDDNKWYLHVFIALESEDQTLAITTNGSVSQLDLLML